MWSVFAILETFKGTNDDLFCMFFIFICVLHFLYFHLCFVFGEPNNDEQVTRPRQRGVGSEKNILFRFVCTPPAVLLCTLSREVIRRRILHSNRVLKRVEGFNHHEVLML